MSAPTDDAVLDALAQQPDAQAAPASLVVDDGTITGVDQTRGFWALLRRYRVVRDLLALARQKNQQQDGRLTALETDVAAIKAKVGL